MSIVKATRARDPALEKRDVLGRPENISLLRSLGDVLAKDIYRHFVPLGLGRTFVKKTMTQKPATQRTQGRHRQMHLHLVRFRINDGFDIRPHLFN